METSAHGIVYGGGRRFSALKNFVEKRLASACTWDAQKWCSAKELENIEQGAKLSINERFAEIQAMERDIESAKKLFDFHRDEILTLAERLSKNLTATRKRLIPVLNAMRIFERQIQENK